MKNYMDMTNSELRLMCAKIFEKTTGIHVTRNQIILLEGDSERIMFECGNLVIDHRDNSTFISFVNHDEYIHTINRG